VSFFLTKNEKYSWLICSASRGTNDVGVQTDKPLFEMGETNIYEGLTGLGLHGRVFRWTYQNGGLNLWNDAINKQFQEAVTSGRVIQLRQLKEDLESTLTTGKKLLEMMNSKDLCEFSKGIQPGQARDFGNCIEMVSDVSKGIGSLEGWLTILTTKLEPFDYDTVLEYDSDSLEE
jgi:hypothetical protein